MRNIIAIILLAAGLCCSCDDAVHYHHYEKIADEGWDVRDTVVFSVDTIREAGTYTSAVCLRASEQYPYQNISLMVYQTIFHRIDSISKEKAKTPNAKYIKGRTIVYTMPMEIKQEDGVATGQGVTHFTYDVPYAQSELHTGDSLAIVVRHHMRREILPGITDIGFKLTKE